ncbi:MAG: pectinacetylesterase family protein [Ilumatobacteraceae bacterium]|nr:pectinacetylesterase family protein [Ilumatobacteraceae bacterium]
MGTLRKMIAVGALFGLLAACGEENDSSVPTDAPTTAAPAETTVEMSDAPEATVADTTPVETAAAAAAWETIVAPVDCRCGDGSEFSYFVRKANPAKVMFFLEGGGACFSAETCDPANPAYKTEVGGGAGTEGIFEFDNPLNPFADYSIVYVPYCTGDVHVGNTTHDYGNGVVVNHNGYVNGSTALNTLVKLFPDAAELVVTGESAGSVPTPLYAGLAADLLPDARITVLGDGSGAYPDIPGINAVIGDAWGTMNAVPDWPTNADVTVENWSLPGLYVRAGKHAPNITFPCHDYAYDQTQQYFAALASIPSDDLVSLIDLNETQIEAAGVILWSFISPGDSHTVLGRPGFYTEEVEGTSLLEWVTALVTGDTVADVHCTVCTT